MNGYKVVEWFSKGFISIFVALAISSIALTSTFNDESRSIDNVVSLEKKLNNYQEIEYYLTNFLDNNVDSNTLGIFEDPYTSYRVLADFDKHYHDLERFVQETDLDKKNNKIAFEQTLESMRRYNEVNYMEMYSLVSHAHVGAANYKRRLDELLIGFRSYKEMPIDRIAIILRFLHNDTHREIHSTYWSDKRHAVKVIFNDFGREGFKKIGDAEWEDYNHRLTQGNTIDYIKQVSSLGKEEQSMTRGMLKERIKHTEERLKASIKKHVGNDYISINDSLPKTTTYNAAYYILIVQIVLLILLSLSYIFLPKIINRPASEDDFSMLRFICFPIESSKLFIKLFVEFAWVLPVVLVFFVLSAEYNPHYVEISAIKAASNYGEVRDNLKGYDTLGIMLVITYFVSIILRGSIGKRLDQQNNV